MNKAREKEREKERKWRGKNRGKKEEGEGGREEEGGRGEEGRREGREGGLSWKLNHPQLMLITVHIPDTVLLWGPLPLEISSAASCFTLASL